MSSYLLHVLINYIEYKKPTSAFEGQKSFKVKRSNCENLLNTLFQEFKFRLISHDLLMDCIKYTKCIGNHMDCAFPTHC